MPKPAAWLRFLPLLLFTFALGIRLIGITWGLKNDLHNQSYHPDEPFMFAVSQSIEPTKGKFTPGFYNYGTLYLTGLRVIGDVVSGYGGAPDPKSAGSQWTFASRVHLGGRLVSAVAGAFTAVLVFLILRRWLDIFSSLLGGLIPAVSPGFVVHSRFQTVDVLATALIAASTLYALWLIAKDGEEIADRAWLKYASLSGMFAGLSAGTKYTGILALFTLFVAAGISRRPGWWRGAILGLVAAIVAFVVSTPGSLLDQGKFLEDVKFEMAHTATGHGLVFVNTSNGFAFHFANMMVGFGPIITILGLIGLFWAAGNRERWAIAVIVFFLAYYLVIARAEVKFLRYVFPLLIGVALGFGYLIQKAIARTTKIKEFTSGELLELRILVVVAFFLFCVVGSGATFIDLYKLISIIIGTRFCYLMRHSPGILVVGLGIAGIGGIDPGGLRQAAIWTSWMVQEDPRDQAVRYLRAQTNPGTLGLASDPWFYSPPTWPDSGAMRPVPFGARLAEMSEANPPTIYYNNPAGHYDWDLGLLDTVKPNRVALSSFEVFDVARLANAPLSNPVDKLVVDRGNTFLNKLSETYEIERAFGTDFPIFHDIMYVHPQITIWKQKAPANP